MKLLKFFLFLILPTIIGISSCLPTKSIKTAHPLKVYSPVSKELYDTIAHLDSVLFNFFNLKDIDHLKAFLSKDIEVYQDNIGLRNYDQTITAFTGLFEKDYVLKRELVKGTLEVYPIKDYGAIETGQHTFCHTENGKYQCGTFKFIHVWQQKDGQWKIVRLITYDH